MTDSNSNSNSNGKGKGLQKFEHAFEGHPVTTIRFRGRECWVARQIGEAMQYADPSKLTEKITTDWGDEFQAGLDFDVIAERDLKEFKALMQLTPDSGVSSDGPSRLHIDPRTPKLLLLYESGMNIACMRAGTEPGKRMRRWLATEVLPAIRRTGAYAAGASPASPTSPASAVAPVIDVAGARAESLRIARMIRAQARRYDKMGLQVLAEHTRLSALEAAVSRPMPELRMLLSATLPRTPLLIGEPTQNDRQQIPLPSVPVGHVPPTRVVVHRAPSRPKLHKVVEVVNEWLSTCCERTGEEALDIRQLVDEFAEWYGARYSAQPGKLSRLPGVVVLAKALRQCGVSFLRCSSVRGYGVRVLKAAKGANEEMPVFVTHPDDRDEELSRDGFPTVVEWRSFLEAWWATLGPRVVGSEQLVSMCDRQAVLGPFLGTGTERSRRTKLGILVTQRTDLVEEVFASPGASEGRGGDERRGFHVRIERCRDRKYKISMYRLVRVVPAPAD